MKTTRSEAMPCPKCEAKVDAHTGADGTTPRVGDFAICFYCGEINRYDANLHLVAASDDDFKTLDRQTYHDILSVKDHVLKIISKRNVRLKN